MQKLREKKHKKKEKNISEPFVICYLERELRDSPLYETKKLIKKKLKQFIK